MAEARRPVLLALGLAVLFVGFVFLTQSARSAIPDHGDWWTDLAHILAARNLDHDGFRALRFAITRDDGTEVGLASAYLPHWPATPAAILALLFGCESIWMALFRQHTFQHTFTIDHLSLTMSVGAALALRSIWRISGHSATRRRLLLAGGAVLFVASLTNLDVLPSGNLHVRYDLPPQQQEMSRLTADLPANAVVVLDLGDMSPAPDFFVGRTYLRRTGVIRLPAAPSRPWYLVGRAEDSAKLQSSGEVSSLPILVTPDFALFRLKGGPGAVQSIDLENG